MRILLTNDDGFEAEGLQTLFALLRKSHECFVVAPDQGRSCCGHAVTTGHSLEIIEQHACGWTVSGTPADCVRVGLMFLELKPDWIISGVNHGGNLGVDILYSGTVAAAREACLLGTNAIAISQYMRRDIERDWSVIATRAQHLLGTLFKTPPPPNSFWSANLPAIAPEIQGLDFPITFCEPEPAPLKFTFAPVPAPDHGAAPGVESRFAPISHTINRSIVYQSNYQERPRMRGTDVDLCFQGHATVSSLGSGALLHSGGSALTGTTPCL